MSQTFKFVHAADIHLDSPLVGLEKFDDAPVAAIRDATREALKKLVQLCLDEQAAFLLIAGDVYDGEWKSLATGRFFAGQMARLAKVEIPVFVIKGNHDAASQVSREIALPGAHVFDHRKAETVELEALGVAIHGQSFRERAVLEDLSLGYPPARPGLFNIGMLHTSATGNAMHEAYAPCSPADLARKGYDYWALGHVHQRALLSDDPPIVFPGNLQGRHVREPAEEGKGATVVEVVDGRIASMHHVALDVVRWSHLMVDATGAVDAEEVIRRACDQVRAASDACGGCLLAARVTVFGRCRASLEIRRDAAIFESGLRSHVQEVVPDAWIEEIRIETRFDGLAEPGLAQGSLGDLLAFVTSASTDERLNEAKAKVSALRDRIRSSNQPLADELSLDREDLLEALLPTVAELVLSLASPEAER